MFVEALAEDLPQAGPDVIALQEITCKEGKLRVGIFQEVMRIIG